MNWAIPLLSGIWFLSVIFLCVAGLRPEQMESVIPFVNFTCLLAKVAYSTFTSKQHIV